MLYQIPCVLLINMQIYTLYENKIKKLDDDYNVTDYNIGYVYIDLKKEICYLYLQERNKTDLLYPFSNKYMYEREIEKNNATVFPCLTKNLTLFKNIKEVDKIGLLITFPSKTKKNILYTFKYEEDIKYLKIPVNYSLKIDSYTYNFSPCLIYDKENKLIVINTIEVKLGKSVMNYMHKRKKNKKELVEKLEEVFSNEYTLLEEQILEF